MKKALITGITGQDGSYLAKFLLEKGYEVHGIRRRVSSFNTNRLEQVLETSGFSLKDLNLHYGDMGDASSLLNIVSAVDPHEIYNLAAMSHVGVSFVTPEITADVNAIGTLRLLEAIRLLGKHDCRFYQASTSELFGLSTEVPQNELTKFHPRSPYAVSKLFAYWTVVNYREAYDFFACNGILFNHESPFRGENFVTQKIVRELVEVSQGRTAPLELGNLYAKRDWGHASEYVEMQWMMLQAKNPEDYVISTGRQASVKKFVEICSEILDLRLEWSGVGLGEKAYSRKMARDVVVVNSRHFRPAEVENLLGDSTKAANDLGWKPKVSLEELAEEMIGIQLKRLGPNIRRF